MNTETKIAMDPNNGEKYTVEFPASELVEQEILKLDYPTHGITKIEATEKLTEKFELSDKQKNAQTKRGERYLNLFYYQVVDPAFETLLRDGRLEQPSGRRTPYVRSRDVLPSTEGDIEEIYQQIREKVAGDLLQQIKANSPTFFENLVIDLLVEMGYGGSREDAEAVGHQEPDSKADRHQFEVGSPVGEVFAGWIGR